MIRLLALLCPFAALISSLAGCHSYTEEEMWSGCCSLELHNDSTASSEGHNAIVRLGEGGSFNGHGRGSAWRRKERIEKIQRDVEVFLEGDLRARPDDYFSRLGMICSPARDREGDFVRCEAKAPVRIECSKPGLFLPFASALPKELRETMLATLHVSVDVSDTAVRGIAADVAPHPGGRLCHRPEAGNVGASSARDVECGRRSQ
jgi:hypothetical protein